MISGITTMDRPETCALMFRTILNIGVASAIALLTATAFAQQNAAPAAQPAPYVNQQAVQPAPTVPTAPSQATPATQSAAASPSTATAQPAPPASAAAASTESENAKSEGAKSESARAAKPVALQVPRELSPWS